MSSTRERLADEVDRLRREREKLLDVVKAARAAQPAIAQGQRAMQHLGWTHTDVTAIAALSDALDALE